MPAERLSMRKLREILRLHYENGLSGRAIARSCQASSSTVQDYLRRAAVAELGWPPPAHLDDVGLEKLLFPNEHAPVRTRPEPDWVLVHRELQRKHVTKLLVWQEYREAHADGMQYSQFCERYGVAGASASASFGDVTTRPANAPSSTSPATASRLSILKPASAGPPSSSSPSSAPAT